MDDLQENNVDLSLGALLEVDQLSHRSLSTLRRFRACFRHQVNIVKTLILLVALALSAHTVAATPVRWGDVADLTQDPAGADKQAVVTSGTQCLPLVRHFPEAGYPWWTLAVPLAAIPIALGLTHSGLQQGEAQVAFLAAPSVPTPTPTPAPPSSPVPEPPTLLLLASGAGLFFALRRKKLAAAR